MDADISSRFWAKVHRSSPDECWPFTGKKRYGAFYWPRNPISPGRRVIEAHRVAYYLSRGPITDGLHVLHKCDDHHCVNPAHLYLGTHQQNMKDREDRHRSWSPHGELNPSAKLNMSLVAEIRTRYRVDHVPQRQLAKEYGVAQSTIGRITRGTHWRMETM